MGQVTKYSATRLVADALGVSVKLIPESLRNRINSYKANGTIPSSMFEASRVVHYDSIEFKPGNLTYIRNLTVLDTLFDNPQHVKKLMLKSLDSEKKKVLLDSLFTDIKVRRDILNAIGEHLEAVRLSLMSADFDMEKEELPNPFSDGYSVTNLLLSQIDNQKSEDVTLHDKVLKEILKRRFDKADELLSGVSDVSSANPELNALRQIVSSEIAQAKSYHSFLKNL